jgi:myo-inositol-1-phosphate synthase
VSKNGRVGVWLVGAYGGVGASLALGISALKNQMTRPVGLTTVCDPFSRIPFVDWSDLVLGGHEVRSSDFRAAAVDLHRSTNVFSTALLTECAPDLEEWSNNVRPGLIRRSGRPVEAFSNWQGVPRDLPVSEQVARLAADIREFTKRCGLEYTIVANVSSSEPTPKTNWEGLSWKEIAKELASADAPLPASSVYALAAVEAGAGYINFTPSLGLSLPGFEERAKELGVSYCGKDGKTGETLMKSVLAPMFAQRNLHVLSWVGHNILGNRDGLVLQDQENKQGKLQAKDRLLAEILGYEPQTLVSIEYIQSMGDRKTAWDHVHFEGFLGTPMTLQFIWQGCDSLLAAPLLLDLVRWTEFSQRRGETGCLKHLASYFKSPMHVANHDFAFQRRLLDEYAQRVLGSTTP